MALAQRGYGRPVMNHEPHEDAPATTRLLQAWPEKRACLTVTPDATTEAESVGWVVLEVDDALVAKLAPLALFVAAITGKYRGDMPDAGKAPTSLATLKPVFRLLGKDLLGLKKPERSEINGEVAHFTWSTPEGPVAIWSVDPTTGQAPQLTEHHAAGTYIVSLSNAAAAAAGTFNELMRGFITNAVGRASKGSMTTATSKDEDVLLGALVEYFYRHQPGHAHKWDNPVRNHMHVDSHDNLSEAASAGLGRVRTRPDFLWEDEKVVVFLDGLWFHGGRMVSDTIKGLYKKSESKKAAKAASQAHTDALAADLVKSTSMTAAGYKVLRYSDKDLKEAAGMERACAQITDCLLQSTLATTAAKGIDSSHEVAPAVTVEVPAGPEAGGDEAADSSSDLGELFSSLGL